MTRKLCGVKGKSSQDLLGHQGIASKAIRDLRESCSQEVRNRTETSKMQMEIIGRVRKRENASLKGFEGSAQEMSKMIFLG